MQLLYLKIENYKNLQDFEIDFKNSKNISLIIGNNGSGKSNIIEAISGIFAGLFLENPKKIFNSKTPFNYTKEPFNYIIHFKTKGNFIKINYSNSLGWKFLVKKGNLEEREFIKSEFFKQKDELLPSQVIANYSGEEGRLFNLFYKPFYDKFKNSFLKIGELKAQRLCFVNRYFWQLALLSLIYKQREGNADIDQFMKETLRISEINNITFKFNPSKYKKYPQTDTIKFVQKLNPESKKELTISFDELMKTWDYSNDRYFFNLLSTAYLPKNSKIITDIKINYNQNLDSTCFSEGEKKLILLQFILEVLGDEESLILLDEPDSHIHISRKEVIKDLISKYHNRSNILTTHSPTLTHSFDLDHIISIEKIDNKVCVGNTDKFEIIDKITGGIWNYQQQNIFYSSKKDILLVEGQTDKIHIEQALKHLSKEYPELEFDVYDMKGCKNIKQMMIGLANCGQKFNHKIIGIFDNDHEGKKEVTSQNFHNDDDKKFMRLKNNDKGSYNNFFAVLLPKKDGFSEKDYTIENLYSADKYEKAYLDSLERTRGHFGRKSIDEISTDIKNKSKTILAEMSKEFEKDDFENFKPLFEILKTIKNLGA